MALWGPEGSKRDLGSPTLITPGIISTWTGKSSSGEPVVAVPSPTSLSLLLVTFNFELAALFKELLMSKSARFIGCGEQSCSPAFF